MKVPRCGWGFFRERRGISRSPVGAGCAAALSGVRAVRGGAGPALAFITREYRVRRGCRPVLRARGDRGFAERLLCRRPSSGQARPRGEPTVERRSVRFPESGRSPPGHDAFGTARSAKSCAAVREVISRTISCLAAESVHPRPIALLAGLHTAGRAKSDSVLMLRGEVTAGRRSSRLRPRATLPESGFFRSLAYCIVGMSRTGRPRVRHVTCTLRLPMVVRRLVFTALALALLLRGGAPLSAAPAPAAPDCPMAAHEGARQPLLSCCTDDVPQPGPMAPPLSPHSVPGPSSAPAAVGIDGLVDDSLNASLSAALAWTPSPTHDLRRLDLSVFLSVFLI